MKKHDVWLDTVTTGTGVFDRIICKAPDCREAAIVRQPWMNAKTWEQQMDHLLKNHPAKVIRSSTSTKSTLLS